MSVLASCSDEDAFWFRLRQSLDGLYCYGEDRGYTEDVGGKDEMFLAYIEPTEVGDAALEGALVILKYCLTLKAYLFTNDLTGRLSCYLHWSSIWFIGYD